MNITDRQGEMLNRVVKSYINLAEPVSSEYLKKRYRLNFSTATIRSEMQRLTDSGYLYQSYISAGRVPTDKGYRFFVDTLKRPKVIVDENIAMEIKRIRQDAKDYLVFLKESSRLLSLFSSNLAISYIFGTGIFIKDGWKRVFNDPEFSDVEKVKDFLLMIDYFEENIDDFDFTCSSVQIYIGNEAPISKADDFSIVISKCSFFEGGDGFVAILGPKRMAYNKNVLLLDSIVEILNNSRL